MRRAGRLLLEALSALTRPRDSEGGRLRAALDSAVP